MAKLEASCPFQSIDVRLCIRLSLLAAFIFFYGTVAFAQSPSPRLNSIEPASGTQATTLTIMLNGSGFTANSKVAFSDPGIVVQSVRFVSSRMLEASVVLSTRARQYSVVVWNGSALSNAESFAILPARTANAKQLQVASLKDTSSPSWMDPHHVWVNGTHAFVTDYANSVLRLMSLANGTTTTLAGKEGEFGARDGVGTAARFGQPAGVWSNATHVYVSDAYFDTIRRISLLTGNVDTLAGSSHSASGSNDGVGAAARFRSPNGLWGDGTSLFVSDTLNFTVRKIVIATGEVKTLAGRPRVRGTADGTGAGAQFFAPLDLWGDGTYLYVADGSALRRVTIATSEVITLAGTAEVSGYADGASKQALFSFISGVWGDGENLFVADSGNNAIRRISIETGLVTTVAGGPITGNRDGLGQTAHFDHPTGIAGDGNSLFIIDRMNSNVRRGSALDELPPKQLEALISSHGPNGRAAAEITALVGDANRWGFELEQRGGTTRITSGKNANVQTGYGRLSLQTCCAAPAGLAIVGYERNRVLVSETTVAASELIRAGIIPADFKGGTNTGLAVANPNAEDVTLTFSFKDEAGNTVHTGTMKIPARGMITGFLNERPYAPPRGTGFDLAGVRTFSFQASAPVGVTALRGHTNGHSDFLASTLPIAVPGVIDSSPLIFPHYADGGGWRSRLTLVNPTNARISGTATVFDAQGQTSEIPYSVAQGSAVTLNLPFGHHPEVRTGWIRVLPKNGDPSPSGLVLFSLESNGHIVTEGAIAAATTGSEFRLFVETSGDFTRRERRSIRSSFALTNPGSSPATMEFELFALDGSSTGLQTSISVAPGEQVSMFIDQLPGFENLSVPFQGFLQISGAPTAVVGLRTRYNERGDLLITPTPPVPGDGQPSAQARSVFPFIVDGGGYTTQFVLLNSQGGVSMDGAIDFVKPSGEPLPLVMQ